MTSSHSEQGPTRGPNDLSFLDVDQILPVDPVEIAKTMSSNEIHGRAVGQAALAEARRNRIKELEADLALARAQLEDTQARMAAYFEAYEIARSMESGE